MRLTPFKKVIIIFFITILALIVSLPREFTLIDRKLYRSSLNVSFSRINIKRDFDLKLGLDLAGGSHLAFVTDTSGISEGKKKEALQGVRDVIERRVNFFGVSEPNVQISSFEGKDRIIVELPGITDPKEAVELIGQTAQLVFSEVGDEENPGFFPTDLTGADLKSSRVEFDQTTGEPVVSIEFSAEGAVKFAQITKDNMGKPLAIMLDNFPVSAPIVQQEITGGQAQITGGFELEEAKNLSIQLNAGALPVPIELVEEKTVGATLGADSVEKSVRAGLIGLGMVLLFMILSYGKMGMIADIALIIFGILTLALYKFIPVVLTLPGIAGFLLSVGMAVDSNILIFERFKEERDRYPLSDALEISFGRAWDSIRDANIATLVTAFILANPFNWSFLHTSGPVRGFAITLALGIAISLFTGIVVSRNLLRVFIKSKE